MKNYPLIFEKGHVFIEINGNLWVFDTGSPLSFGTPDELSIMNNNYHLATNFMGLTVEKLNEYIGVQCVGLLGVDVINNFDHIIDIAGGTITISTEELEHSGKEVKIPSFMGIPIIEINFMDKKYQMIFDTGAQVSYFQNDAIKSCPYIETMTDFYPLVGEFKTEIYRVDIIIAEEKYEIRCGKLPGLLGVLLTQPSVQGIIGNEILLNKKVGYFPRRELMIL